jgi:hypothetical protein
MPGASAPQGPHHHQPSNAKTSQSPKKPTQSGRRSSMCAQCAVVQGWPKKSNQNSFVNNSG